MDKNFILDEIRRTAEANGGKPLGTQRFEGETGIRKSDWYGKYWRNWGEAIAEAGLSPNEFQRPYDPSLLLEKFLDLTRELGRIPTEADLRIKARTDRTFPSHSSFSKLGTRSDRVRKLMDFCTSNEGFQDVLDICPKGPVVSKADPHSRRLNHEEFGSVYLMKSGRFYKIGRTNAAGRRERELTIQLPEKAQITHEIRTDDPPGIEAYWHRRFADKRKNGEWFELTSEDIAAFKRRKFM